MADADQDYRNSDSEGTYTPLRNPRNSPKKAITPLGAGILGILIVIVVAVMLYGRGPSLLPGSGKSTDDRLHKLELDMTQVKGLEARVTALEKMFAQKFAQGQGGASLADEVDKLARRVEALERQKAAPAAKAPKKR